MIELGKKYRLSKSAIIGRYATDSEKTMISVSPSGIVEVGEKTAGGKITVSKITNASVGGKTGNLIWFDDEYFLINPELEPYTPIDFPWGRLVLLLIFIAVIFLLVKYYN